MVKLILDITNKCNLSCRDCPIPKGQNMLTLKDVRELLESKLLVSGTLDTWLAGSPPKTARIGWVDISGGEPTLNPELGKMLDYFAQKELANMVSTNAIFPEPLVSSLDINPDINIFTFVQVSLPAVDRKIYASITGQDFEEMAEKGLEKIAAQFVKTHIKVILRQENLGQIQDIVRLAKFMHIPVVFQPAIPFDSKSMIDVFQASVEIEAAKSLLDFHDVYFKYKQVERCPVYSIFISRDEKPEQMADSCPFREDIIYVTADKKIIKGQGCQFSYYLSLEQG